MQQSLIWSSDGRLSSEIMSILRGYCHLIITQTNTLPHDLKLKGAEGFLCLGRHLIAKLRLTVEYTKFVVHTKAGEFCRLHLRRRLGKQKNFAIGMFMFFCQKSSEIIASKFLLLFLQLFVLRCFFVFSFRMFS
ncbi:hypothetical protein Tcan_01781, partial [Toxocara canis]